MITRRELFFLVAILISSLFFSCKKDRPPLPEILPKVELSLTFSKTQSVEDAVLNNSSTTDGDYFFTVGGENPIRRTKKVDIYNGKTQQWTTWPLSAARSSSNIIAFKGKLFVAGGDTNIDDRFRVDMYEISTGKLTSILLGDKLYGHTCTSAIIDNRYLIFHEYTFFHVFDSQENKWETIDIPFPDRIFALGMVAIDKKLYINGSNATNVLMEYNFESRTWKKVVTTKYLSNSDMMVLGNQIYFYGNNYFDIMKTIDIYDPKNGVWSTMILPKVLAFYSMSFEKESNSLVITGGRKLQTINGNDSFDSNLSDDLLIYQMDNKTWREQKMKTGRYGQTTQFINGQFIIHGGQTIFNNYLSGNLPTEIYTTVVKHL